MEDGKAGSPSAAWLCLGPTPTGTAIASLRCYQAITAVCLGRLVIACRLLIATVNGKNPTKTVLSFAVCFFGFGVFFPIRFTCVLADLMG